jgi:hypothetical protein
MSLTRCPVCGCILLSNVRRDTATFFRDRWNAVRLSRARADFSETRLPLDDFLGFVVKSELLREGALGDAVAAWRLRKPVVGQNEVGDFCAYLVESDLLTRWQCQMLLKGKFKRFWFDRYKFVDLISVGTASSVYLATHAWLRYRVAITVFGHEYVADQPVVDRIVERARLFATIPHQGLVRVFDIIDGPPFSLVSEFVDGLPLADLSDRPEKLPLPIVGDVIAQITDIVAQANTAGVAFHNISVSNVLVDVSGAVRVLTPSIGAGEGADAVGAAASTGDEAYRADVRSIGRLLYVLLTGNLRLPGGADSNTFRRSVARDRPDATQQMVYLCESAIGLAGSSRFRSAADLLDPIAEAWEL